MTQPKTNQPHEATRPNRWPHEVTSPNRWPHEITRTNRWLHEVTRPNRWPHEITRTNRRPHEVTRPNRWPHEITRTNRWHHEAQQVAPLTPCDAHAIVPVPTNEVSLGTVNEAPSLRPMAPLGHTETKNQFSKRLRHRRRRGTRDRLRR